MGGGVSNGDWGKAEAPSHRWMMFDRGLKVVNIVILLALVPVGRWGFSVESRLQHLEDTKLDITDAPPTWFTDQFDELKDEVAELRRLLLEHMASMNGG